MTTDPAAEYQARAEAHALAREEARRRSRMLTNARLLVFVAWMLATAWTVAGAPRPLGISAIVVTLVAFVLLVRRHAAARERARWHSRLHDVARMGIARVRRDWTALPERHIEIAPSHPYAVDLDVVGHASLFTLLDTVSAFPGRPTLADWLSNPSAGVSELRDRQAAALELRSAVELRESLHALARAVGEVRGAAFEKFLQWAEGDAWLLRHRGVYFLALAIPLILFGTILLASAQVIPASVSSIPLVAAAAMITAHRKRLGATLDAAQARAIGLRQHAPMLARLEAARFESPMLERLQSRLTANGGASQELSRLDSALGLAEARAGGLGYAILALLVLWDFQAVASLERWQMRAGRHLREWLEMLGELEALAALGTLAFDNPSWSFPELHEGEPARIDAKALAHPLLSPTSRVANDVALGPQGTILLVTGSNMSGKSTLLRAIGANIVLAHAGAPVCAAALSLPLLRMYTSMRIQDSLERGLSLFMAELERVRDVVMAARQPDDRPFLYLLDEILHGTNTAERQIAARTVLTHLVHARALGAVTTHDLALAEIAELAKVTTHVHFEEMFVRTSSGDTMTFDYRLKPGPATSANAVRLLGMVGL